MPTSVQNMLTSTRTYRTDAHVQISVCDIHVEQSFLLESLHVLFLGAFFGYRIDAEHADFLSVHAENYFTAQ